MNREDYIQDSVFKAKIEDAFSVCGFRGEGLMVKRASTTRLQECESLMILKAVPMLQSLNHQPQQ